MFRSMSTISNLMSDFTSLRGQKKRHWFHKTFTIMNFINKYIITIRHKPLHKLLNHVNHSFQGESFHKIIEFRLKVHVFFFSII